jgi:hypothetical protein
MPWNPVAWWMFRRLRQAVEIDCDRRVLARHGGHRAYGELLVRTAVSRSPGLALAPGLMGRRSLLRRRIEHIAGARRATRVSWLLLAPVAASLTAALALPMPAQRARATILREVRATASPVTPAEARGSFGTFRMREVGEDSAETGSVGRIRPLRETAGAAPASGEAADGTAQSVFRAVEWRARLGLQDATAPDEEPPVSTATPRRRGGGSPH